MKARELIKTILVGRSPRRTVIRAGIIAVFCIILFKFLLIPIRLQGISMEPTYWDGSINLVNTLCYRFRSPKRGDVVAIAIGSGRHYLYLKRVVGLPNERVSFSGGKIFVNGKAIPELYVKYRCDWNMKEELVGPDEYYVVGDNRSIPLETHKQGRVNKEKIKGKPLW